MSFFDDRGDLGPPPDPFRFASERPRSTSFRWFAFGALALVAYLAASVLKSIYVDALWFDSVGYMDVFRTEVTTRVLLFLIGALVAGGMLGLNVMLARRFARPLEQHAAVRART